MMSVMLSAAGSLRWFRDALAPGVEFAALGDEAAGVAAGSDGLLFLPYLTGERSPHPDPLARGAFVGLTVGHERRHLTRAVMEGVAFGLRDGLDLMVDAGVPAPSQIRASGGGIASPVWRQILADVLGAEIATVRDDRGRRVRRRRCWRPSGRTGSTTSMRSPRTLGRDDADRVTGPGRGPVRRAARRVPEALSGARPVVRRPQRLSTQSPGPRANQEERSLRRGARAPRARPR